MDSLRETQALGRKDRPWLIGLMGLFVLWNIISWSFPFFWDTVLNSRIAQWYLDSEFVSLTVPEKFDAGHPPFFNLYLALIWKITGKSLAIAHAAMLPFLLTIAVQFYKLAKRFVGRKMLPWALLLLFLEPTFLAQSSMITPDIAMVAFFLLSINAILDGRRWLLAMALIGMAAVTFRGILLVPSIFLMDAVISWWKGRRRPNWRGVLAYLPVAVLVLGWLILHYQRAGWLLSPPAETYGEHRQILGISGMMKNIGITIWRWLDFGRIALWAFVLIAGFVALRRKNLDKKFVQIGVLLLIPMLWLSLLFIPFSNPIGHRYFMLSYMMLGIAAAILLGHFEGWKRWGMAGILGIALLSGHFWVYPDTIAQGWDSTLAHLRIHGLNEEMESYLAENKIYRSRICSDFPLLPEKKLSHIEAEASPEIFKSIHDEGMLNCNWILQSNVSNGFSDEILESLQSKTLWKLRKEYHSGGVYLRLYQFENSTLQ